MTRPRPTAAPRGGATAEPARAESAHAAGDGADAAQEHRRRLDAHVRTSALKWTRQRETILDAFLSRSGHFTTDEIRAEAARVDPSVGLATVYRTLRLFVEAGIASERRFQDGVTRYEVRQPHHDHLICVTCGTIVEFERDEIERLQDDVAREHGFRLHSHRHELYGTCAACSAAEGVPADRPKARRAGD